MQRYQLDIVGLISTYGVGSGVKLLGREVGGGGGEVSSMFGETYKHPAERLGVGVLLSVPQGRLSGCKSQEERF